MDKSLVFERPICELEEKIEELKYLSNSGDLNIAEEISRLQKKASSLMKEVYKNLTPWQKVLIARHPERPKFLCYRDALFQDFLTLSGDRCFGDDLSIIGGIGRFKGQSVMVIGIQKGTDTESRIKHNFGMAKPEGYRKAKRLMELADRFLLPIITFVDTPGAYPGLDAEERGQAEAIASCLSAALKVKVPLISIIVGEGGSGGAVALAAANKVLMLEHSIYSVISPEGCASILWRSAEKNQEAAEAQKLTAQYLKKMGIIDDIIEEPIGGAHRFPQEIIQKTASVIQEALSPLTRMGQEAILKERREKFLRIGRTLSK